MSPDSILSVVKWVGAGVAAIAILVISVINLVVNKKRKGEEVKPVEVIDAIASPISNIIQDFLPTYMSEAETVKVDGAIKKILVLAKVALKCNEIGVDYQANSNTFSDAIEKLIALSKSVNNKGE